MGARPVSVSLSSAFWSGVPLSWVDGGWEVGAPGVLGEGEPVLQGRAAVQPLRTFPATPSPLFSTFLCSFPPFGLFIF